VLGAGYEVNVRDRPLNKTNTLSAWSKWRRNEFERGNTVKIFLVVLLHFSALKAQLVVLVSVFVMVSAVWSVYCLLFFYSWCPPCPAICKSGGTCPPVPNRVGATAWSNTGTLKLHVLKITDQQLQ